MWVQFGPIDIAIDPLPGLIGLGTPAPTASVDAQTPSAEMGNGAGPAALGYADLDQIICYFTLVCVNAIQYNAIRTHL